MPIKTYRADIPELSRTCISTIIELPVSSDMIYVPKAGEHIESVEIAPVKGHKDMLSVAIILSTPKAHTKDASDA